MERLIAKDSRNAERVFPYIGGEEINDDPTHAHHRYVISFEDWPLRRDESLGSWARAGDEQREEWLLGGIVPSDYPGLVASDYTDLVSIVSAKVKPERDLLRSDTPDGRKRKKCWWLWGRYTPSLFGALREKRRVLALSRVGQQGAFAFLPTNVVFAESVVVFIFDSWSAFCTLQSRVHETWARFFSSSMKDDLRYAPSDCFETFPFPKDFETLPTLDRAGREYYEFRAALMVKNNAGLTATYNRFHDPEEENPDILRLRELHAAMDRAVLDAYDWTDIQPKCEFVLDYEEEEDEEENGARRRKKPWRYRWPDEIRDEVLARLLELNRKRALEEGQEEAASMVTAEAVATNSGKKRRKKKTVNGGVHATAEGLFAKSKGDS
jgi:hypothetical protein